MPVAETAVSSPCKRLQLGMHLLGCGRTARLLRSSHPLSRTPATALAPVLFQQLRIGDDHAAVGDFALGVDGQQSGQELNTNQQLGRYRPLALTRFLSG